MNSIELKFKLHDKVRIEELRKSGIVISIWITFIGIKYEVQYFDNAEARATYFFDFELTAI